MPLRGSSLKTRVASRMVLLFLLSAIVPTAALALVGYYSVTTYLHAQAHQRVYENSKHLALALLTRLQQVEDVLASQAGAVVAGRDVSAGGRPRVRLPEGTGRLVKIDLAQWAAGQGAPRGWPAASPERRARLSRGEASLITVRNGSGADVWLLRGAGGEHADDVYAMIVPPDVLTATLDEWLVEGSRAEVRDASGTLVASSAKAAPEDAGAGWTKDESLWLTGAFTLPLQYEFGTANWTVIAGQPVETVYSATSGFVRQFLLVIALGLITVSLLSLSQVRRELVPLEHLHAAVRRFSGRDFGQPVAIVSRDEFGDLAAGFNDMRERLHRQFNALSTAAELDRAILSTFETDRIVGTLLDRLPGVIPCSVVALSVFAPELDDTSTSLRVCGSPVVSREPVLDTPVSFEPPEPREWTAPCPLTAPRLVARTMELGASRVLALPLVVGGRVSAALVIGRGDADPFAEDEHRFASQLTTQIGVALANAALVHRLDRLNTGALNALARAIDAKSSWTAGHSERVTELGLALGRELGVDQPTLAVFRRAGLLHDIGKIGIPAAILDKAGPLTPDERRVMNQHPALGARILAPLPEYAEVIPIVLEHHERFDGTGYPRGLTGEEISLGGRVFAVADVYDALTSSRPYRAGLSPERAMEAIHAGRGRHFDPKVVDAFVVLMRRRLGQAAPPAAPLDLAS